ncbi:MAG: endonuclease MutS2 [Lachnospiraceae bacterium]
MNQKALKVLEYDKIIDLLMGHASCELGREQCKNLLPMNDPEEIRLAQKQTADALRRIYARGSVSFSGTGDIAASLKRLEIGASLGTGELLRICKLLETAARVKQYSRGEERPDDAKDSLDDFFDRLEPCTPLSSEIRRCILSEDEIADDASANLKSIRRRMSQLNDKVHSTLNSLLNGSARSYLQDAVITMRNGRYCLPVKAEYRSQVPGMIHDQSSTGSTLFIEPMSVVKINNDFKELELKEQEEIEIILAGLSAQAAMYAELIADDLKILARLDFIFAKALLAKDMKATEPLFNTKGQIYIKDARHPLLDRKKAVPITIYLGRDFDLLVVTGPNTGGKTVSLKTVGLLTLMGQSGLHIPAFERSKLALFDEVYADIGDEQSIEQSLSTFSSHMTNIVGILKDATPDSLVLMDELGAGTDPTEGAALAIAILSDLHARKIRTMVTTHYSELKVFALSSPGVENACCEFDVETLRPTYRLLIGVPGKSNAFAISGKLGLPEYIIENAKNHISKEDESFEDLLSDLEESRKTIENEQEEIRRHKEEIKALRNALENKKERLDRSREEILRKANEEARAILADAKKTADETIRDFQKYAHENPSMREMEEKRRKLREKMDKTNNGIREAAPKPKKQVSAKSLHLGDAVRVLSLNLKGTVNSLPDAKGNFFVQMGILRSQVNINDIELIEEVTITAPSMAKTNTGKIRMSKSYSVSAEINLIGMTVDEALAHLDKYLDDAYLAHMPSVRIVHGKGTGKLREAVQKHLKRCKYVKTYRLGEFGEGDAGVTIAEFK